MLIFLLVTPGRGRRAAAGGAGRQRLQGVGLAARGQWRAVNAACEQLPAAAGVRRREERLLHAGLYRPSKPHDVPIDLQVPTLCVTCVSHKLQRRLIVVAVMAATQELTLRAQSMAALDLDRCVALERLTWPAILQPAAPGVHSPDQVGNGSLVCCGRRIWLLAHSCKGRHACSCGVPGRA